MHDPSSATLHDNHTLLVPGKTWRELRRSSPRSGYLILEISRDRCRQYHSFCCSKDARFKWSTSAVPCRERNVFFEQMARIQMRWSERRQRWPEDKNMIIRQSSMQVPWHKLMRAARWLIWLNSVWNLLAWLLDRSTYKRGNKRRKEISSGKVSPDILVLTLNTRPLFILSASKFVIPSCIEFHSRNSIRNSWGKTKILIIYIPCSGCWLASLHLKFFPLLIFSIKKSKRSKERKLSLLARRYFYFKY